MKKIGLILSLFCLLGLSGCIEKPAVYRNGFKGVIQDKQDYECYLTEYYVDELVDDEIHMVIPDEIDGYLCYSLGIRLGYSPNKPLKLITKQKIDKDRLIVIYLHIGKNIGDIRDADFIKFWMYNRKNQLIRIETNHKFYLTCDEENAYYYAKNGQLYERGGDDHRVPFDYYEPNEN